MFHLANKTLCVKKNTMSGHIMCVCTIVYEEIEYKTWQMKHIKRVQVRQGVKKFVKCLHCSIETFLMTA